jgi:CheY-like chemotaxis protein
MEPFFTTKDVGKGTGLGLSMVHGFVTRSGGSMSIESEEGVGTTVSLFLPRLKQEMNDTSPPLLASGRVLVADDDDDVRAMAISMLRRLGFSPEGVADADLALQFLRAGNEVAILFSDVRMPGGMNGLQLAEAARTIRPELTVILTSGFTGDEEIMRKIRDSCFAFLTKPYDMAALGNIIQIVLQDKRNAA